MADIRIGFDVDDTPKSLAAMLEALNLTPGFGTGATSTAPASDLEIDLSECHHLGPMAVAFLFGLRRGFLRHGRSATMTPPQHHVLRAYCGFSGLLNEFDLGGIPADHPNNVTVPTSVFDRVDLDTLDAVLALVHRFAGLDEDTENQLRTVMLELIQNVLDHSGSPDGGILSARAYRGEREVRLAVFDTGLGIRTTLDKRMTLTSDEEAVATAVRYGITG